MVSRSQRNRQNLNENERNLPNRQKTHEIFNHEENATSQKRKQLRKSEDKRQYPKTANKFFTERSRDAVDLLKEDVQGKPQGMLSNSYSTGEVKKKQSKRGDLEILPNWRIPRGACTRGATGKK
ncbi:hypothetical protein NC653_006568 [Populus alba x Populus x berolinensis]|nr:hypothetical protein NC653_006508 [Populus alba x Populus x berolinensis]KAJ7007568.1 hypothetical protein NC653_006568 [Populus alba x Populus x berolinensis]